MPCTKEGEAVLRLLTEGAYGMPAWMSFSCKNDGASTNHGESFVKEIVPMICKCPSDVVFAFGVNCTSPDNLERLISDAYAAMQQQQGQDCQKVILAYPNSGEEWDYDGRCWKTDVALDLTAYAAAAKRWVKSGVRMVGGCCRTTPEHVLALRQALLGST
eukprot:gene14682-20719_t